MVNNINQCLFHLTEMAMAPFKMDFKKAAAPRTEDDEESRPHDDMDFKKVAGSRYVRQKGFLGDPSKWLPVHVFGVVWEPLRILCPGRSPPNTVPLSNTVSQELLLH